MIFINSESRVNSRLFSVIRGHFFNVISGLRPANLDCRIASGDDYKMERGEVLNNITFKGLDVVRQYAALLERCVQSSTRVRKAQAVTRQTNPIGRIMIEMLGVLAIIAVLSVGGIAGYSKAMTKWKTNKTIEQTTNIIDGLTTLLLNQKQLSGTSENYPKELDSSYPSDIELFKTLGIIDEEMLVDGELKTPFGGDFGFFVNCNVNDLLIYIYDLPREACMAIATATWGNGKFDISVNTMRNTEYFLANDCYDTRPEYNSSQVSEGATLGCYHDGGVPLTPDKAAYGCSCEEASCRIDIYFQKFI